MTATSFIEWGGLNRPSRVRTVLVVSSDAGVRSDWARHCEALGMRTRRCVGPQVLCALLVGQYRCPLHDEADVALYDRDSLSPDCRRQLLEAPRLIPIAIARDGRGADGRHVPFLVELIGPTVIPRSTG